MSEPTRASTVITPLEREVFRLLWELPDGWSDFDPTTAKPTTKTAITEMRWRGVLESRITWQISRKGDDPRTVNAQFIANGCTTEIDLRAAVAPLLPQDWQFPGAMCIVLAKSEQIQRTGKGLYFQQVLQDAERDVVFDILDHALGQGRYSDFAIMPPHVDASVNLVNDRGSTADGPGTHREFWWSGTRYVLTKRNWQIISEVWPDKRVTFLDLGLKVWGQEKARNTIAPAISKAVEQLNALGIPLNLPTADETVWLERL